MLSSAVNALSSNVSRRAFYSFQRHPPKSGRMDDLLDLLGPLDSIFPPSAARLYAHLFRKSIKFRNVKISFMAHAHLKKSGLSSEPLVSNVLLNVYAKAGLTHECAKVFDEMPLKDIISWCTLISGFVTRGLELEAFELLKRVSFSGLKVNQFIISTILKGCSNFENSGPGVQVHAVSIKSGFQFDSFVEVGLISFYAKQGEIENASKLFYEIPVKCLASWNAIISGYTHLGFFSEAIDLARIMCRVGFFMDLVALRVIAGAGSSLGVIIFCKNLLSYSIKHGLDSDNFIVVELMKAVSKVGDVESMGKLFSRVRNPDAYLYALTITGYQVNGRRIEAVKHAEMFLESNLSTKPGALVSVLTLCHSIEESSQLHAHILKKGHQLCLSVSNALISTYMNLGSMKDAGKIFHEMPEKDLISWTTIISGLTQNSKFEETFRFVHSFIRKGIRPDKHALTAIVNACSATRALRLGQQCHALALTLGVDFSGHLSSSFIHMYSKCEGVEQAQLMFYSLPSPSGAVPTNAMLAGYNWNSMQEKAIDFFCAERRLMFIPDEFTFSSVLDACSDIMLMETGRQLHSLTIKMGFEYFDVIIGNAMMKFYMKSEGYLESAQISFSQMHRSGLFMNPVALSSVIRCCIDSLEFRLGKQVHALVLKTGFLSDALVFSAVNRFCERSAALEGVGESSSEALNRVNGCWSSTFCSVMDFDGESMGLEVTAKARNVVPTWVSVRWVYEFVDFFREVEESAGCCGRLMKPMKPLEVVESHPSCRHSEVQSASRIPVFCFVDQPESKLFCARNIDEVQRGLTSAGQHRPQVRVQSQACVLDGSSRLFILLCVYTSGLASGVFLGQPKSILYLNFQVRTDPERNIIKNLR